MIPTLQKDHFINRGPTNLTHRRTHRRDVSLGGVIQNDQETSNNNIYIYILCIYTVYILHYINIRKLGGCSYCKLFGVLSNSARIWFQNWATFHGIYCLLF